MPYCGLWSAVEPGTRINLSVDYTAGLAAGDAISSISAVQITVLSGVDARSSELVLGSPKLDAINHKLTQAVGGEFIPGVSYAVNFNVNTIAGEQLNFWGKLTAQAIS